MNGMILCVWRHTVNITERSQIPWIGTGRMKCGYGVENILRMFRNNMGYRETHNAVLDAEDELQIMQLLGHGLHKYDIAHI